MLETDEWARAHDGTVPWAFKLGFGNAGDALAPLTIDVDGGAPVTFRGRIDRVDRAPDGSRYFVYDYKTGSPTDLTGITNDPVLKGRRLQLAIYATAVQRSFPDAEVGAHYWFTRRRDNDAFAGLHPRRRRDRRGCTTRWAPSSAQWRRVSSRMYPGADGYFGPDELLAGARSTACARATGAPLRAPPRRPCTRRNHLARRARLDARRAAPSPRWRRKSKSTWTRRDHPLRSSRARGDPHDLDQHAVRRSRRGHRARRRRSSRRIVGAGASGIPMRNIAAITFTEKAAAAAARPRAR